MTGLRSIGIVVCILLCGCAASSDSTQIGTPHAFAWPASPPQLSVTGEGEVWAKPDLVVIKLGAEVQEDHVSKAQSEVNEIMQKATAALREKGVDEKDMQTLGLTVSPVYSGKEEDRKLLGYAAENVLQIRIPDPTKSGPLIDVAIAAGVNRLDSIAFQLENDHDQLAAARKKAAKNAQEKAATLAAAMGVKLLQIESISEGSDEPGQSLFGGGGESGRPAATTVEQGEVRVQATVNVSYRIAPAN